jgi:hypothetical protein
MQDDVKKLIFGVLAVFTIVVIAWIGYVYIAGCGFSLDCSKAAVLPERTPIPTLIPAALPVVGKTAGESGVVKCQIAAVNLIGAWVKAGFPESSPFTFIDLNGSACTATYEDDVSTVFEEANLWYAGAPACITCHHADVNIALANMDLSSYEGILAGSRRSSPEASGNDILGNGNWEESLLYSQLFVNQLMPQGRPESVPAEGPVIFAGTMLEQSSQ